MFASFWCAQGKAISERGGTWSEDAQPDRPACEMHTPHCPKAPLELRWWFQHKAVLPHQVGSPVPLGHATELRPREHFARPNSQQRPSYPARPSLWPCSRCYGDHWRFIDMGLEDRER